MENEIIKSINEKIRYAKKLNCIDSAGEISDGFHTFNELYHHRAILFASICTLILDKGTVWKSKLHNDGTMFDGMFICGIDTPYGQATYHYDIDPYWDLIPGQELYNAPEWDGHTPEEALERINNYCKQIAVYNRARV